MAISRKPPRSYSIAEARDRLAEILYEAEEQGTVQITRRGVPVAVLLAEAEHARLVAAAGSPDLATWLGDWRAQLPAGFEGITADELARWRDLG